MAEDSRATSSNPYPIAVSLEVRGQTVASKIVKMAPMGFLAEVENATFKVGGIHMCHFSLPETGEIATKIRVIKTYNQYFEGQEAGARLKQLVECHFIGLSREQKESVNKFLTKSKQA